MATTTIDELIELVGSWITKRAGWAEAYLPSWTGPNQVTWTEDFGVSQGDAAVMIDDLQTLRDSIASTMDAIATENASRRVADGLIYEFEPPFDPRGPVGPYLPPPGDLFDALGLGPTTR